MFDPYSCSFKQIEEHIGPQDMSGDEHAYFVIRPEQIVKVLLFLRVTLDKLNITLKIKNLSGKSSCVSIELPDLKLLVKKLQILLQFVYKKLLR